MESNGASHRMREGSCPSPARDGGCASGRAVRPARDFQFCRARVRGGARLLLLFLLFGLLPPHRVDAQEVPVCDASPQDRLARGDLVAGHEAEALEQGLGLIRAGLIAAGQAQLREVGASALDPAVRAAALMRLAESELRGEAPGTAAKTLATVRTVPSNVTDVWRVRLWEGAAHAEVGDRGGAVRALRDAAEGAGDAARRAAQAGTDPEPARAARVLALRWAGWLELSAGDAAGARHTWRAALADPAMPSAAAESLASDLAESWFAEAAWDSVIAVLTVPAASSGGVIRPAPQDARGLALLGRALFERGETAQADSLLALVTEGPAPASGVWSDQALLWRGWIALTRERPEQGLGYFKRVRGVLPPLAPLLRYAAGLAHLQREDFAAAESTLALGPMPREADPLRRPWAYARAYAQYREGRYAEAIATLDPVTRSTPRDPVDQAIGMLRGDVSFRLGRMTEAYTGYSRAGSGDVPATEALLWRRALAALGSGQWGTAARVLDDLLLRFPGAARASDFHFWRGEALYRLGRLPEARPHFTRAERLGADPARCAYALGACDYQEGEWESALRHLDRARELGGVGAQDADLARRRGQCLLRLGRSAEAGAAFAEAEALGRGVATPRGIAPEGTAGAWALYWEAYSLLQAGEHAEAARRFRTLQVHPAAPDSLRLRASLGCGEASRGAGDLGGAIACFRTVCESPSAAAGLRRSACASLFSTLLEAKDWTGARQTLEEIQALLPAAGMETDLEAQLATALLRAGRYRDALTAYQTWSNRLDAGDPQRLEARYQVARCREALGEYRGAATEYVALGEIPGCERRGEALKRAAELWMRLEENRRALKALERRLSLDLDPAEAARTHALLAQVYQALKQRAAAANEWEKVVHAAAGAPDSLRAVGNLNLGRKAFEAGQWDVAYAAFVAADSLGALPAGDRVRYWAGESALRGGSCPNAIRWFQRFLSMDAPDPVWEAPARMRLGECYTAQGRPADAQAQYEIVLRLPGITDGVRRQVRERLSTIGSGAPAGAPGARRK
jgi:tetratricopeptide (TPR) repeat protein